MSAETYSRGAVGRHARAANEWAAAPEAEAPVPMTSAELRQATRLTPQVWKRRYVQRAFVFDLLCALVAGALALEVRFSGWHQEPLVYLVLTAALPVLWCACLALADAYDTRYIGMGSDEYRGVMNALIGLAAGVAIASYAFKLDLARGYLAVALPATGVLDLLARYRLRKHLHKQRRKGRYMQRVVAVGHARSVADLIITLRKDVYHGMEVVGACLVGRSLLYEIAGVPVCGGVDGVSAAVREYGADTVAVLACPEFNGVRLRELAWQLEQTNTDLCVAPALLEIAGPRTTIRSAAGMPLLHLDHTRLGGGKRVFKNVFDRVAAAVALIVLAPVFVIIALAIRLDDPGPAIFRQTRVGQDGRAFRLYKFRTMVVEAERLKAKLGAFNEGSGHLFKMRADPRVTKVGAFLRRTSLDELPQLINVVLGEMSLVGPRPALPAEAARHSDHMRRRLLVRPGITGLWQVSGRSDLSWEETVRLDVRYVDNWSLMLDLQIMRKTLSAVMRRSGAY